MTAASRLAEVQADLRASVAMHEQARTLANSALAERDALETRLAAVREIVENYGGWYDYSPEDSWRFERDLRKALDMPQYEPENCL